MRSRDERIIVPSLHRDFPTVSLAFTPFPRHEDLMKRSRSLLTLAVTLSTFVAGCGADTATPTALKPSLSASSLATARSSAATREEDDDENDGRALTIAVIGDTPYGAAKLAEFPSLVAKINADAEVGLVLHAGDIKAGKNADCSDSYFDTVRGLFDTFADPLVYTPGDNEWTDCHVATKNNGLYTPTERLQAVRARFFPVAGRTLGLRKIQVSTQARDHFNSDFIENVMWSRSGVVFAAINIPGSNNDGASWGTPLPANAGDYPSQAEEQATRKRADSVWIARTFERAREDHAPAVVLLFQADMWDTTEPTLAGYDAVVQQIGALAARFRKPVLLLEGDSHIFSVANPFSASSPFFALHPNTPVADNVTRIVLEGSDKGRTEYLRLKIAPKARSPFSWERVPLN
jgi:hypothetical protein